MLSELFSEVLNMSLTGCVVIGIVAAVRFAIKKAPKIFSYALWAVVLFRLLCPVSLSSPLSAVGLLDAGTAHKEGITTSIEYVSSNRESIVQPQIPTKPLEYPEIAEQVYSPSREVLKESLSLEAILPWIWLMGVIGMMLFGIVTYVRFRVHLTGAVPMERNVYLVDHIDSAFVAGLLRPRIYLPSDIPEKEMSYILEHEKYHLRRLDHVAKHLAFLALSIHWFNPLVWVAFILSGKDMEMSCDEAVIQKLGEGIRADYSVSLLNLTTGRKIIAGTPLAFGEGDTKGRVRNMARWKQPKKWVRIVSFVVCIAILTACAANPELVLATGKNDIYFAAGNDHYALYAGHSSIPGPEITLLSRTYIDPDDIHVSMDIQAEYTVFITPQERGVGLTSYEIMETDGRREVSPVNISPEDFPLYIYQHYAGIDWTQVGEAYTEYVTTMELHKAGEADADQVKAAFTVYNNLVTEYVQEYMKLELEDIPRFYEYLIQICISTAPVEETLKTVQVTIGEKQYNVEIGEISIQPGPEYVDVGQYLSYVAGPFYGVACYPYGPGIEECQSQIYCAQQPLTLTGLHFWENTLSTVDILDVTVVLADSMEDILSRAGIEIPWDGKSPIYAEQGQYIGLYLTVQDDRMKQLNYHSKLYPVLEFTCDGRELECASEIPLLRKYGDPWLLYAVGLDGMDMESYFNDYYYVAVSRWRNKVPLESWAGEP